MSYRTVGFGSVLLLIVGMGCVPGGASVLRAPTQQLHLRNELPGRVAAADAPSERKLPQGSITLAEPHELPVPAPASHQVPSPKKRVMVARRSGERSWSARQQPPLVLVPGGASVAVASARGRSSPPTVNTRDSLPKKVEPVLAFPEPGLDDTAAYQGYQTRFYRDSKGNTVQIYLQRRSGRAVLVWADAANESAGFTARDAAGRPADLDWGARRAAISDSGSSRALEYHLAAQTSSIELGWFVLGSMRIERDFVYAKRDQLPYRAAPFRVAEESLLVAAVERLPSSERKEHLSLLHATSLAELQSRLLPAISTSHDDSTSIVRVERPSLDGRNHLRLELRVDPRKTKVGVRGNVVSLRTRPGSAVRFSVRVTTDAAPLTPLTRQRIFTSDFLAFVSRGAGESDSAELAHRRLERQVRGIELLSSEEKLMAGLPNFATYFGRDMMMTALMMRPIWQPVMSEHVIASVLRKLGPKGDVSHEEALGGQAIREHAAIYDSLITVYTAASRRQQKEKAAAALEQATGVLSELQKTRENYHMIDDEFQLPVLTARYLADSTVPANRKREFLLERSDTLGSQSRLALLLKELALVASLSRPYAEAPRATNLVSFPKRDSTHWRSASWRDSDAGYAGGRFAMDINVIWVPNALRAISTILDMIPKMGISQSEIDSLGTSYQGTPLEGYIRDRSDLQHAIDVWNGARRHFIVSLSPAQVRRSVKGKLAWLPAPERRYWQRVLERRGETRDSLIFLALSLDTEGRPIRVVNTDPATHIFLDPEAPADTLGAELKPFLRPFPVGLFVEGLGPLVANDAYASRAIWERFQADQYHSPRVVWGREVNLLLLGLANQVGKENRPDFRDALRTILDAVNASGLQHNELWSYQIKGGKLIPVRYGTSSDVQLWNTTNLVVQYTLAALK
jgi:hypothetical protein